jgi:hypothetical protein
MPISRSPFVNKPGISTGSQTDTTTTTPPLGSGGLNPFQSDSSESQSFFDTLQGIGVAGYVKAGGGSEKLKSTVRQEQHRLDKAYRSSLAKIARSTTLDQKGKDKARKRLTELYNTGMTSEQPDDSAWSMVKGLAGDVISVPAKFVSTALDVTSTASRFIQSGVKEAADLTYMFFDAGTAGRNPNGPRASWSDFVRQGKDKDFRLMPQTGYGWLDTTIDLAIDIATDPLTYAGVGQLKYIGAAGRSELMVKFGTTQMLAKHPQLVGKLAEIGKYGVGAIPKEVRLAEGIGYGVRYMGKIVPKTEFIASALIGKKGIITAGRQATGAIARGAGIATKTTGKFTPASRKAMKMAGIGYNAGLSDKQVVEEIAHYTAQRFAKGYKAEAYRQNIGGIRDLLKEMREAGVDNKVYKLVESPEMFAKSTDAQLKDFATRYMQWQDEVRNGVNNIRLKFNTDYGANMKEIGFVDDYLHHKMTDRAFRFAYGERGQATGLFKDSDLTPMELGQNTGAAMHRTLRAPEVQPDGTVKYSKFMDEDVVLDDEFPTVIDKVNEIFRRKTGEQYDFFETDIFTIADSYAYSMGAARGREAYVRRLLDYGGDVARVINTKVVPDKDLVASLTSVHAGLVKVRSRLASKVTNSQIIAKTKADSALKTAGKILEEKDAKKFLLDADIKNITASLNALEIKLNNALINAGVKNEAERGAFADVHRVLIDQVRTLRSAIESGRVEEQVAYDILKDIFLKVRPDAKRIPKSATELYNAVARAQGVNDPQELKELTMRLKSLQSQLADNPPVDADELNDLLDIEVELTKQIEGYRALGDVKMEADYADDGLLYGKFDDLLERPYDPDGEPVLRVIDTRPIAGTDSISTSDEISAMRRAQLSDPNTVAVHAVPTEEVMDMRTPEAFNAFWDLENGVGDAVGYALNRAGIDPENAWGSVLDDLLNGDIMDPMFEQVYPEMASIMELIVGLSRSEFPHDIVDDEFIVGVFKTLDDLFMDAAYSIGREGSEVVSKQMWTDFMMAMVNESTQGKNLTPILFPSKVIHGFDNDVADGAYSLLLPDEFNYAKRYGQDTITDDLIDGMATPVSFTNENDFIRSIVDADYHTASLEVNSLSDELGSIVEEQKTRQFMREGVAEEAKRTGRQIGNVKSVGSRRVKAAERAMQQYERSGLITIRDESGKRLEVTVDEATRILTKSEEKLNNKIVALEERLMAGNERVLGPIQRDINYHRQRLVTLVDQKRVIEKWNAATGDALRADVDALSMAIHTNAPTGVAGTNSREWSRKVTERINNIAKLEGTGIKDAWERVSLQLASDEAKLAMYDSIIIPANIAEIDAAKFAGLANDILDGWTAIESTGIQIPKEFADVLKPNVAKMRKIANSNAYYNVYKRYNQIFKIYATMTPGFVVRNAMSATFMNKVAGVENSAIMDGTKAMIAYHKHGPDKWLDVLKITDAADRAIYQDAMRAVMATGRGIQSDFIAPALKGTWGEKIVNNKATQMLGRANEFTENAVRFPMALDSLRKGYQYDEAVYRITRYHFDYTDLSGFDETMKNFIPFWVWTSRNLPLQMTEQIIHPNMYMNYERLQRENPVASDLILPSWLGEARPIGLGGSTVLAPDLPQLRLGSTAKSLVDPRRLLGQANPLVKLPIELLGDKQLAMDIPFTDKYEQAKGADKAIAALASMLGVDAIGQRDAQGNLTINPKVNYALGNLIPTFGTAQRLSGGSIGGKANYSERMLTSWLNAAGVPLRNVGPQQQRGELIGRQFKMAEEIKRLSKKGKVQK